MKAEKEPYMSTVAASVAIAAVLFAGSAIAQSEKPTIVLVHGAFADSSSWSGVITKLQQAGYRTVAIANPLRSVSGDARYVADVVAGIEGSVVLVGHSYGGHVISNVVQARDKIKSLVFVAAFAPDAGESAVDLAGKFPGGTLGKALASPVALSQGGNDLYIDQAKFHDQFARDVPSELVALMAAGQLPVTEAALAEKSGEPSWKSLPSYFVYRDADKNIPAEALSFMADRAGSRRTRVVEGASHAVMLSSPAVVADLIEEAAN